MRQNEFNFIACSNYFLSPAKVDLLPTDRGSIARSEPPPLVRGLVSYHRIVVLTTSQWRWKEFQSVTPTAPCSGAASISSAVRYGTRVEVLEPLRQWPIGVPTPRLRCAVSYLCSAENLWNLAFLKPVEPFASKHIGWIALCRPACLCVDEFWPLLSLCKRRLCYVWTVKYTHAILWETRCSIPFFFSHFPVLYIPLLHFVVPRFPVHFSSLAFTASPSPQHVNV